ncbi:MAG: RNA polymerase sigma factor RpoD, partial [Gammaproteobacteria bacterium]|nr:RNA polymerase sigma factor RpoD [Gammaproteobacteria bacterium]
MRAQNAIIYVREKQLRNNIGTTVMANVQEKIQDKQSRLRQLIAKGKEQGYLTYAQVNDHLPNEIVDPGQIEEIIGMINDMGVSVHEVAPDTDDLKMHDASDTADEVAAEEAAAALAAVENEFGRTTDPVRMYMREMGTVELLTREGEIVIAKRIEDGLRQVLMALADFPATIDCILNECERIKSEEVRLTDIISGFVDPNEPDTIPVAAKPASKDDSAEDTDDDEAEVDTGPDPEEAARIFTLLKKQYNKAMTAANKNGRDNPKVTKMFEKVNETFLELKLMPKLVDRLQNSLRNVISRIRTHERVIMGICVDKANMPRKDFITSFPDNETDLDWLTKQIEAGHKYSAVLEQYSDEILKAQKRLITLQDEA